MMMMSQLAILDEGAAQLSYFEACSVLALAVSD